MPASIKIADRNVGPGHPTFVIAEAGVNHNGDLDTAKRLVEVAAAAGADAVKFQTFNAETVASPEAPKAQYQLETTDHAETQMEMLRRLELSPQDHGELKQHCLQSGIVFLSTPFDQAGVDLLAELDVPAFKISSGDITNLPLLEHVARIGKPVLLSTGMSDLDEVAAAVSTIRGAGCDDLILLQCVTAYPARAEDVNLRAMHTMTESFKVPVGFSDHTVGIEIPLAAVALGACVIEKHFTLDRNLPGPDHRASLEPGELRAMVEGIRKIEVALGDGRKGPAQVEIETAKIARRSLFAAQSIDAGTRLTAQMIAVKRPGTGLSPAEIGSLIGRTARVHITTGSMLSRTMFE